VSHLNSWVFLEALDDLSGETMFRSREREREGEREREREERERESKRDNRGMESLKQR
jgi:hypothetical protein